MWVVVEGLEVEGLVWWVVWFGGRFLFSMWLPLNLRGKGSLHETLA